MSVLHTVRFVKKTLFYCSNLFIIAVCIFLKDINVFQVFLKDCIMFTEKMISDVFLLMYNKKV